MQSRSKAFAFSPNFNWDKENLFLAVSSETGQISPPVQQNFELLTGEDFLLLDGDNFELLE